MPEERGRMLAQHPYSPRVADVPRLDAYEYDPWDDADILTDFDDFMTDIKTRGWAMWLRGDDYYNDVVYRGHHTAALVAEDRPERHPNYTNPRWWDKPPRRRHQRV